MIAEAREVLLSRKDRKVLEACCRSPVTLQRDLKRPRIVLLAAAGRSTRSIATEVGVQPRIRQWRREIVSLRAILFPCLFPIMPRKLSSRGKHGTRLFLRESLRRLFLFS